MTEQTCSIEQAAAALKRGEPVIFPTDTVYGLGVSVEAAKGPAVLYDLKQRERGKPIAWLVGSVEDLMRYAQEAPEVAQAAAHAFWPGALTLIVCASKHVPQAFQSDEGTIGLRMPCNETALELIRLAGSPLATTSANISGCDSTCSLEALDATLATRVGVVVAEEDGVPKSGIASTVIDCTHDVPRVVREGAITLADIQALNKK